MASGKEGVFRGALARFTLRSSPADDRKPAAHLPGALRQQQVRGAAFPPLTQPASGSAATRGAAAAASSLAASPHTAAAAGAVAADDIVTDAATAGGSDATAASEHADARDHSPVGVGEASGGGVIDRASDPALTASIRGSLRTRGLMWEDESAYILPTRIPKFTRCLDSRNVDMDVLRELAWSGVPACYRVSAWQLLLGYLPTNKERQAGSLAKKKLEYQQCVATYFGAARTAAKSEADQTVLRQVLVDVPRTLPEIPICRSDFVQRSLERVLYVWAMRHPASGYVQGINDIAAPFYAVFLSPWCDISSRDLSHVDAATLLEIEADVYWCLTKLMDGIQDHFTPAQPGIQRMIYRLRELVHRIDEPLVTHLEGIGVEFHQFAFRWMNCLLMRELPFHLVIRLWDTCLAETEGFDKFHTYVCAALLLKFSAALKGMKFQELVTFLQKLPTRDWRVKDVEELVSQAFVYKSLFESAPSHLA